MNPSEEKKARAKLEAEWRQSANLVRRMFDLADDCPSVRCPLCHDEGGVNIPHMRETVFGGVDYSTSGPGLIIKFECEEGHKWQLRLIDHSGGTWLSVT